MNLLFDTHPNDADLGHEVGRRLRRFDAHVTPNPPAWRDLIERAEGAVVPFRADHAPVGPIRLGGGWSVGRARLRGPLVAAALVAVVVAGALLVDRGPERGSQLQQSPTSLSAAAPTDAAFDAHTAPEVWASGLTDPISAARAYLAAAGFATDPAVPGAVSPVLANAGDGVATVEWTTEAVPPRRGTLYLRAASAASGAAPTWLVVGAAADDVALADVRYDGDQLTFTIVKTADTAGPVAVNVWADGRAVQIDADAAGDTAVATTHPDARAGQLLDIDGAAVGATRTVTATVDAGTTLLLRLQQLIDGRWLSVTEMAMALPGADVDTPVVADVHGGVDAQVEGDVDTTGPDGPAGGTEPEPLVTIPDVTNPDLTIPDLGDLEDLPPLPAPTLPVPTSLPGLPLPTTPSTLGLP